MVASWKNGRLLESNNLMSNIYTTNYAANPDLKPPVSPSWYNVGLGRLAPELTASLSKPVIPKWLIPFVGIGIVAILATTRLYRPILIGLIGIIALWFMQPYT